MIVPLRFPDADMRLEVDFGEVIKVTETDIPYYTGPYEVTPSVDAQTLHTAKQVMDDNVQVHAIPFFDVSNPAGGTTVYIGQEVTYGN